MTKSRTKSTKMTMSSTTSSLSSSIYNKNVNTLEITNTNGIEIIDLDISSIPRPPEKNKPSPDKKKENMDTNFFISDEPTRQEIGRRANPKERKKEKEAQVFKEGIDDIQQQAGNIFAEMSAQSMTRLRVMILNFMRISDDKLYDELDLRQFAIDSGETITNVVIQELCVVQPDLVKLNMTDCRNVSDVGMWAIARHLVKIKELILAGCHQITSVGLRSISLRCSNITVLNFNNCHLLDDIALSVIATGAWHIEELYLRGCVGVTDTGVGKFARASERLRILDLNGCSNVGEFGDRALKEIGTFCTMLTHLDFSGCKRVEDQGIRAVAVGCTNLRQLCISGCELLTNASLKALCKQSRYLETLFLSGYKQLTDADLEFLNGCAFQNNITSLDLIGCHKVSDRGVGAICHALGSNLINLGVAGSNSTDFSGVIIASLCEKLQSLNLSHCSNITDNTVATVVKKVTSLTTLKLDGNRNVTMKGLYVHLPSLEFCDMANKWLGYQPKKGSSDLIVARQIFRMRDAAALKVQCALRRKFAFKRWRNRRRWWLLNKTIPKFQAAARGRRLRKKFLALQTAKHRIRQVIKIQAMWRRYLSCRYWMKLLKAAKYAKFKIKNAIIIQRYYWGLKGRQRAHARRIELANERLREAREHARRELKALLIQRIFRAYSGRLYAAKMAALREIRRARALLEERMTRVLQRYMRGMFGRTIVRNRREEIRMARYKWLCALNIQRCYRGLLGRRWFKYCLEQWWIKKRNYCSTQVQRIFRGYRGRILAAVAAALKVLRTKQNICAIELQRFIRGCLGRMYYKHHKAVTERFNRERAAVLTIQRLYRGHKGREVSEINAEIARLEQKARPLFDLVLKKEADASKLAKIVRRMESRDKMMQDDIFEIERELENCMATHQKYCDSARINGTPQRFLTKYLRVRLKDHYEHEKELYLVKLADLTKKRAELRKIQLEIQVARRELVPLTAGVVVDVKRARMTRLRKLVRAKKTAATKMQSLWRRALVRWAYKDTSREYWIECFDEAQSDKPYYFNTWSNETVWKEPLSYKYFKNARKSADLLAEQAAQLAGSDSDEYDST